jgi:hypothetical protein
LGTQVSGQAARRIFAEAVVNGTSAMVDALWSGRSADEAVQAGVQAAILSVPGAVVGGSENPVMRRLVAPLTAGATAYAGAIMNGGSREDGARAAAQAIASNVLLSSARFGSEDDASFEESGRRLGERTRAALTPTPDVDSELSTSFARTFDQPGSQLESGGPTTVPPEVAQGIQPQHLGALRRVYGRALTQGDVADLGRVWNSVTNPGEPATLTAANSRDLFDNQRARFWGRVRQDPAARRIFTDEGMVFDPGSRSAPYYNLPNGRRISATIDHIVERQSAPTRALDPANLRISTRLENTVLLRQITAQDPFQ